MKFKLEIELGNDAMQTPQDIHEALLEVCEDLDRGHKDYTVRDINGNTVGSWEIK